MIITKLIGGLGNQIFQYATGRVLAEKNNCELKLDITGYEHQAGLTPRKYELQHFNTKENFASREEIAEIKNKKSSLPGFLRNLLNKNKYPCCIKEKSFNFNPKILGLKGNIYLDGYWQSEKYFKDIRHILIEEFKLKESPNNDNQEILNQINTVNSVSLHVRRGDYANNPEINNLYGLCDLDYYQKAIDYIAKNTEDPHFFLFSDDISWVKGNLQLDSPCTVVDCNNPNTGFYDLELMKNCRHNIIANSSFSWWGGWLNDNENKIVIAPYKWFNNSERNTKDLLPEEWIKL